MKRSLLLIIPMLFWAASCSQDKPLATVGEVELERYVGKWYEIVRMPNRFEEDCACVTAEYGVRKDGNVSVLNTCYDTIDSETRTSEGKAFPVEGSMNSELQVQFFWPFRGDYYVMALDNEYQFVMVGAPSRSNLWILARRPTMPESRIDSLLVIAQERGFTTDALIRTPQYCTN